MISNNESRRFAFGRNEWKCYECPAIQAGFDPTVGGEATYVAELYDSIVRGKRKSGRGVLEESEAKEAWGQVMRTISLSQSKDKEFEIAQEIAHELGWDDL